MPKKVMRFDFSLNSRSFVKYATSIRQLSKLITKAYPKSILEKFKINSLNNFGRIKL